MSNKRKGKTMKPDYCINEKAKSCLECCYKNYGRDCMNNKIEDEQTDNEDKTDEEDILIKS